MPPPVAARQRPARPRRALGAGAVAAGAFLALSSLRAAAPQQGAAGGVAAPTGWAVCQKHRGTAAAGASRLAQGLPFEAAEGGSRVAMAGRTTSQGPSVYNDGWRQGRYNLWMEEQMGGNWMNISQLKEYTHPSGRLKSRYLTKLFMSNHNRAMIYIKRLQCLGLMPYHRIQAKMASDPAANPPPPKTQQFGSGGERPVQTRTLDKDATMPAIDTL